MHLTAILSLSTLVVTALAAPAPGQVQPKNCKVWNSATSTCTQWCKTYDWAGMQCEDDCQWGYDSQKHCCKPAPAPQPQPKNCKQWNPTTFTCTQWCKVFDWVGMQCEDDCQWGYDSQKHCCKPQPPPPPPPKPVQPKNCKQWNPTTSTCTQWCKVYDWVGMQCEDDCQYGYDTNKHCCNSAPPHSSPPKSPNPPPNQPPSPSCMWGQSKTPGKCNPSPQGCPYGESPQQPCPWGQNQWNQCNQQCGQPKPWAPCSNGKECKMQPSGWCEKDQWGFDWPSWGQ